MRVLQKKLLGGNLFFSFLDSRHYFQLASRLLDDPIHSAHCVEDSANINFDQ